MSTIHVCSWNATGLMSSALYLSDLLDSEIIDICGISEHWLYPTDLHFLNSINPNYTSLGICDSDLNVYRNRSVGKGGVALLWKKKLNQSISPLCIESDKIVGIQLQLSRDTFVYILQVYLPCSNHRIEQFREHIEQLFNLISMLSQLGSVILMGNFNAHLNGSRYIRQIDRRGQDLYDLMSQVGMFNVTTSSLCEGTSTSYVSYDKRHESLIDHVLITADLVQSIFSCRILDDDCLYRVTVQYVLSLD